MINGLISLASYGFYGGGIGDMLSKWEQMGFFSYLLPFLLIFTLVYTILTKVKIFEDNRTVNGIIALVVGFMALQFDFVSIFFAEIFPRMGVGLAVLLVLIIFVGLFFDPRTKWVSISFFVVAVIIAGYILIQTSRSLGLGFGASFQHLLPEIVPALIILAFLIAVVASGKTKSDKPYQPLGWFDPNAKAK
jgi:hypothetical protein